MFGNSEIRNQLITNIYSIETNNILFNYKPAISNHRDICCTILKDKNLKWWNSSYNMIPYWEI